MISRCLPLFYSFLFSEFFLLVLLKSLPPSPPPHLHSSLLYIECVPLDGSTIQTCPTRFKNWSMNLIGTGILEFSIFRCFQKKLLPDCRAVTRTPFGATSLFSLRLNHITYYDAARRPVVAQHHTEILWLSTIMLVFNPSTRFTVLYMTCVGLWLCYSPFLLYKGPHPSKQQDESLK